MKPTLISIIPLVIGALAQAQTGISKDDSFSLAPQTEAIRSEAKAIMAAAPNGEHLYIWKFGTAAELIFSRGLRVNEDRVAAIAAIDALQFRQMHSDMGRRLITPVSAQGMKLNRLIILSDFDHKPARNSPFLHKGWPDFIAQVPPGVSPGSYDIQHTHQRLS